MSEIPWHALLEDEPVCPDCGRLPWLHKVQAQPLKLTIADMEAGVRRYTPHTCYTAQELRALGYVRGSER